MAKTDETLDSVLGKVRAIPGGRVPQLVRENIAFWILYEKLAPEGKFPSIHAQRKGLKALGGLKNFVRHRKLGKLAFKWLTGEWHEETSPPEETKQANS